jgi:hypothetical protein
LSAERDKVITSQLEKEYGVDDYFFPNISFELEVPGHLRGEVQRIRKQLQKAKIEADKETVYSALSSKRDLIKRYSGHPGSIKLFKDQIVKRIRPVGAVSSIEYLLATIVFGIAFSYLKSFADEAGKISARRLLSQKDEHRIARQIKCSAAEIRLAKPDAVLIFYDLRKRLLRRKKGRSQILLRSSTRGGRTT